MKTAAQKKIQTIDALYYFNVNIKLLAMCGLKCSMTKNIGKFAHKIPIFIVNVITAVALAVEINYLKLAIRSKNMESAVNTSNQAITSAQCISKGFLIAIAVEKIQDVLQRIRLFWQRNQPDDQIKETTLKDADAILRFCKYYIAVLVICITVYSLPFGIHFFMQFRSRDANNNDYDLSQTIFAVEFPIKIPNISTYLCIIFCEQVVLVVNGITWVNTDILFAQATSHICLQFKALKHDVVCSFNRDGSNSNQILIFFVKRHSELLRMCTLLEEIFSPIIFFTVMLTSVDLCVDLICIKQAILKQSYATAAVFLFRFPVITFQMMLYCLFAEKITEETMSVAEMAYNLNWTTKNHKLRCYIQFILLRAQRPFQYTSYKFFPVGNKTLANIIRKAFSYYMLLEVTSNMV